MRLPPIWSAPSNSSARQFRTCASRAVGELFKSHPRAARWHTRTSVCITQPNGASRASLSPWREVAPFGIDFVIVEPGPTSTNFSAGLVRIAPMEIYRDTPAGAVRRAIAQASFALKGDAGRTVDAIISAAARCNRSAARCRVLGRSRQRLEETVRLVHPE
jgi:hypothetical protein